MLLKGSRPIPVLEQGDSLGAHLRRRRRALGLTQRDAADRLSVSPFTLGNWENGDNQPMIQQWPALISFLGYEPWPEPQTLPEKLRAERRRRGLSIKAAAKLLQVDEATFWWWEAGRVPHGKRLEHALEAFLRRTC